MTSEGPGNATFVIDCSGGLHVLARQLRIPILKHSPQLVARFGYVNGSLDCPTPSICPDQDGWTWIAEVGPGCFLAGDSAAVLDPSSSHGVLRAIMSGMIAAYLVIRHLCFGTDAKGCTLAYQDWLTSWFRHDVKELSRAYRTANLFGFNG